MYTNSMFMAELIKLLSDSAEYLSFFTLFFLPHNFRTSILNVYHTKGSKSLVSAKNIPTELRKAAIA